MWLTGSSPWFRCMLARVHACVRACLRACSAEFIKHRAWNKINQSNCSLIILYHVILYNYDNNIHTAIMNNHLVGATSLSGRVLIGLICHEQDKDQGCDMATLFQLNGFTLIAHYTRFWRQHGHKLTPLALSCTDLNITRTRFVKWRGQPSITKN